jgi:hypothetical protein
MKKKEHMCLRPVGMQIPFRQKGSHWFLKDTSAPSQTNAQDSVHDSRGISSAVIIGAAALYPASAFRPFPGGLPKQDTKNKATHPINNDLIILIL